MILLLFISQGFGKTWEILGANFDSLTVFVRSSRVFGTILLLATKTFTNNVLYYNQLEFGNFALDIIADAVLNMEGKSTHSHRKNRFNVAVSPIVSYFLHHDETTYK